VVERITLISKVESMRATAVSIRQTRAAMVILINGAGDMIETKMAMIGNGNGVVANL
jgi:hypothetical protein